MNRCHAVVVGRAPKGVVAPARQVEHRSISVGMRFCRLVVQARIPDYVTPRGKNHAKFACLCDCGNVTEVLGSALRGKDKYRTRSCGCLQSEGDSYTTHGSNRAGLRTTTYSSWVQMRSRCNDPNASGYKNYGGKGISVCERWDSFEAFLADMGERPEGMSIDRYPDKLGNYGPGNCRWATRWQQARNKTTNRLLTAGGKTLCLTDWAKQTGLSTSCIYSRLRRGWSQERAVVP